MYIYNQKITIIRHKKPSSEDTNAKLQWFGSSLGLFNLRDKDKSCFRIFVELLKSSKQDQGLTSDEIAERSDLSRGTVVHHLDKLIKSGMVVHEKNQYELRVDNLGALVDEIRKDIQRTMNDLREIAEIIDKEI
ncbi:MAG: helix-turn-helix domain-containing protein [Candidatus Woesearchaeota archaeon]